MRKPSTPRQTDSPADDGFIYQRLRSRAGFKLEIVTGGESRSPRAAELLARQVWCENARQGYRTIGHAPCGAPLLVSDTEEENRQRISVSHTRGIFAVATLPPAPEGTDLDLFSPITAVGLDVERADRDQALRVRERFLSPSELELVKEGDEEAHIVAWTCKEAMMKLAMHTAADIRRDLVITALPGPGYIPGRGMARTADGSEVEVLLMSFSIAGGFIASIAYTGETLSYLHSRD